MKAKIWGSKFYFFLVEPLVKILCSLKRGVKILYFFPVPWKRGVKTAEPTNQLHLRGAPPPPGNDSSSVCGVCEAYYISTRCEPFYPKCNHISSNKSMNMTPFSPIHRRQRHFVDCQETRMTQMTKDFAMPHDENYVEWNSISIKSHQFVTNCPYQTIYIPSITSVFLLRFHYNFAGPLRNQIPDHVVVENWHIIYFFIKPFKSSWLSSGMCYLFKKIFLVTSLTGHESPIDSM